MKPKKDIMKALRDKRKAEGLVNLRLWVKPEWVQPIMDFIKQFEVEK